MPRREERLRAEQLRLEAKTNPAIAALTRKRRAAAKKAALTRAAAKAGAVLAASPLDQRADTADAESDIVRWTNAEYDLVAKHSLTLPEGMKRADMLREAQKVLPKNRQKVITDHLGGKSFNGFNAAMKRIGASKRVITQRNNALIARNKMRELRKTLAGQGERMTEAMKRASKSPADVAAATGVHLHSIWTVVRNRDKTMMDKNIAKVATYLGCNYGWLRSGVDADTPVEFTIDAVADTPGGVIMPSATNVFKANGKHRPQGAFKVDTAIDTSLDTAMNIMWPLAPPDVKAFFVARLAELVVKPR